MTPNPAHPHTGSMPRPARGFTLIEILIALLVLSLGLIGLAMLQATGLRFNNDSYMRSQATILAYDIIDRMRANKAAADAGDYCLDSKTPACETKTVPADETCGDDAKSGCASSTKVAAYDISRWYALQKTLLSSGASPSSIVRKSVTTTSGMTVFQYEITMRWSERDTNIDQVWVVEL